MKTSLNIVDPKANFASTKSSLRSKKFSFGVLFVDDHELTLTNNGINLNLKECFALKEVCKDFEHSEEVLQLSEILISTENELIIRESSKISPSFLVFLLFRFFSGMIITGLQTLF